MVSKLHATGPIFASLILACLSSIEPTVADEPACLVTERQPICTCDLTKLRPLQGAVGMKQVIYMENRIADDPKQGRRKLEEDPIKVVAGVGGQLFIIDHHHAADAWLGAKTEWGSNALCKIVNFEKGLPAEFKTEDEFWTAFPQRGRATNGRNGTSRTLKNDRWHTIPATGFCLTPCSRAWLMPSVAMTYPLLIVIAEGFRMSPNK
jgi:hypothetical protein